MRIIPAVLTVLLLVSPTLASGQSFAVQGSGGPTMTDPGHSLAAGLAFSPTSHLAFMVDVERTHLSSQIHTDARGVTSAFRGGTVTIAAPACASRCSAATASARMASSALPRVCRGRT